MKKVLLSLAITWLPYVSHAQKIYLKVGVGYAMPQTTQTLDNEGNPYNGNVIHDAISGNITNFSAKKASFSSGFKGTIGIGYNVYKHVALELDADIGIACKHYTTDLENVPNVTGAYLVNTHTTRYAKLPIMLMPSVVFHTSKKYLNFYCRGGLVLPLNNEIEIETHSIYNNPIESEEVVKGNMKTYFSIGFTGAGGINYAIAKKVNLWLEFNVTTLSLYAKEYKLTEHTVNGEPNNTFNPLPSKVTYSFNGSGAPNEQQTYALPYSNFSFSAGVNIDLL